MPADNNTPIRQLGLSFRCYNALRKADIYCVGDIPPNPARKIAGFGKKLEHELLLKIKEYKP